MKKLIECCQICERPTIDTECNICKRKICFRCSASVYYKYNIPVCHDCKEREDFKKIYAKYHKRYWNTHRSIVAELNKLPRNLTKGK